MTTNVGGDIFNLIVLTKGNLIYVYGNRINGMWYLNRLPE